MVAGLRLFTERSDDRAAGTPILDSGNGEELMHVQPNVAIVLGNRPPESPGTLFISTKKLVWLSDTERTKGYSVDFLSVSLHAVSRDPEAFESPCIYTQSLRGPRGGMIFFKKDPVLGMELESTINNAAFPGLQGGPHNHTIGGLAFCLKHAQSPEFKAYQNQVV